MMQDIAKVVIAVAIFIFVMACLLMLIGNSFERERAQSNNSEYSVRFKPTGIEDLSYEVNTNIVYYSFTDEKIPYYCEHGVPYSFNPDTGELVCISN